MHGLPSWSQFNALQDRQEYANLDPANHDDHGQLGGDDLRHYGGETDHINHGFRTIMNPTKQSSAGSKCRTIDYETFILTFDRAQEQENTTPDTTVKSILKLKS